ncbi:STAS domain-containing protein [Streptomyces sp. NPDC002490]|uniref:STAS domain-containing protein n=1 Tax=Streptomyces sp. NPDC002490 TaxID=3154416 RepID=UPI00331E429D
MTVAFGYSAVFTGSPADGDEHVVLRLSGDLDVSCREDLEAAFALCRWCRPEAIAVDLTAVTFLDSAGFGLLEAARAAGARQGVPVEFTGVLRPPVARFLSLTGTPVARTVPRAAGAPSGRRPGSRAVRPAPRGDGRGRHRAVSWRAVVTAAGFAGLASLLCAAVQRTVP